MWPLLMAIASGVDGACDVLRQPQTLKRIPACRRPVTRFGRWSCPIAQQMWSVLLSKAADWPQQIGRGRLAAADWPRHTLWPQQIGRGHAF